MYIPNEQLEGEDSPLAYQLTIWFSSNKTAEKYPLEAHPDEAEIDLIKQTILELMNFFGYRTRALNVERKKIRLIIDAPVNIEKIINGVALGVIEVLRGSLRFSEKINLWQPRADIEKIWTEQKLKAAVAAIEKKQKNLP